MLFQSQVLVGTQSALTHKVHVRLQNKVLCVSVTLALRSIMMVIVKMLMSVTPTYVGIILFAIMSLDIIGALVRVALGELMAYVQVSANKYVYNVKMKYELINVLVSITN